MGTSDEPLLPSGAERFVARSLIDETGVGKPLSDRARHRQRTVENYLKGEALPRYIQRLSEIEKGTRRHERALAEARAELLAQAGDDERSFAAAWTAKVAAWDFEDINVLVRQHNAWYPIEADLAMDPRTGDYVLVHGRSYRRDELTAAWALARHPAVRLARDDADEQAA